jgi:hypothetical protein
MLFNVTHDRFSDPPEGERHAGRIAHFERLLMDEKFGTGA